MFTWSDIYIAILDDIFLCDTISEFMIFGATSLSDK